MSTSSNVIYLDAILAKRAKSRGERLRLLAGKIKKPCTVTDLDSARCAGAVPNQKLNREQVLQIRLAGATKEHDFLLHCISTSTEPIALQFGLKNALQMLKRLIARTEKALLKERNKQLKKDSEH